MPEHFSDPDDPLTGEDGGSAIGQFLFDPSINFWGVLGVDQNGQFFLTDPNTGSTRPTKSREFLTGSFTPGFGPQFNEGLVLSDNGDILNTISGSRLRDLLGGGPRGPGGPRGLSFEQQQQLLELQQKFELTQAEQQQKFQLEQQQAGQEFTTEERQASQLFSAAEAAKARENQQRLALQGEINNLIGQAVGIRQRSRELLAQTLGQDPFRAAAQLSGSATRGTTPTQAFRNRLRPTARFEAPTVDFEADIGTLQGQAGELREFVTQGLPLAPPVFGLAHGGVVDMKKGRDGKFAIRKFGEAGESILVGEGPHGEGIAAGTAEVATFNADDTVTFTPLRGGAQFGGTFSFGNFSGAGLNTFARNNQTEASPTSAIQALSPLLESVGFENAPIFRLQGDNFRTLFQEGLRGQPLGTGADTFERLGTTRPRLIRNSGTGELFLVSPSGSLQRFASQEQFAQFGFNPNDVVNLSSASMAQLGLHTGGGVLTEAPPLIRPGRGDLGVGAPLGGPILAPIEFNEIGDPTRFVGLPDPASNIRAFNRQPLATQRLLSSAFELAGFGAESASERRRFFTPSGTAQAGTTLRLG